MTTFSSGAGAINRIIELNCNEKLFKDGNGSANALKANYGMAGKLFVEWLEEGDHIEEARKMFNCYMRAFQDTDITDKQIMAASLVLTADELISGLFFNDAPLSIDDVAEFLKTKAELDINQRAYEFICQYCEINKNRFADEDNKGEVWGVVDDDFFYIVRLQFTKICEAGEFNDVALLAWLKDKNLIDCKKGNLKTKKINGTAISCVWLKRPKNPYDVLKEEPEYPFKD